MTDADLIYNACLRAERRLEDTAETPSTDTGTFVAKMVYLAVKMIREEIGNGLSAERRR